MEYALDLPYDILVIDDKSTDGTVKYLCDIGVECIVKNKRRGLTDSWNMAYKYFKSHDYDYMVLCNNDVLIPRGAIDGMLSDYPLVVPMCNESGAGYACKEQSVIKYMHLNKNGIIDMTARSNNPNNVSKHQDALSSIKKSFKIAKCWTGFCMCFSRSIMDYELSDGNLFDSKNVNVGNDDDLAKRVKAYIALGSFVYHFKGKSFNGKIAGRNKL